MHGAWLTDPAEIVALEVDQHDVLRPFLRMGRELGHLGDVVSRTMASWARPRDGTRVDVTIIDADEALGRGAEDGGAAPLRQCGKGRGGGFAEPVIESADVGRVSQL